MVWPIIAGNPLLARHIRPCSKASQRTELTNGTQVDSWEEDPMLGKRTNRPLELTSPVRRLHVQFISNCLEDLCRRASLESVSVLVNLPFLHYSLTNDQTI